MTDFERRRSPPFVASLAVHCAVLFLLAAVTRFGARPGGPPPSVDTTALVWLDAGVPGGGGGGGGNRMQPPARRVVRAGHDSQTVPAGNPPEVEPAPSPIDRDRVQSVIIPIAPQALGDTTLPGSMTAPPGPPTVSQGPSDGDGAGTGRGPGDGPGRGRGLGDGLEENTGGGFYRPGGDVSMPIEIRKGTPQYTSDAMRARAQGAIMVQCVVQASGVCSNIRVTRSFAPSFGLDQEAIKAASQWRFRPGMRRGEPVPVVVTLEIDFVVR